MNNYFRPEWTCGKFHKKAQVAVMYNLIEGICYFFESYTACVISEILLIPKNGSLTSNYISSKTGISEDSIIEFANELIEMGLLTLELPSKSDINDYRKKVGNLKKTQTFEIEKTVQEKLPYEITGAEQAYSEALEQFGVITSVMFERI